MDLFTPDVIGFDCSTLDLSMYDDHEINLRYLEQKKKKHRITKPKNLKEKIMKNRKTKIVAI